MVILALWMKTEQEINLPGDGPMTTSTLMRVLISYCGPLDSE